MVSPKEVSASDRRLNEGQWIIRELSIHQGYTRSGIYSEL